MPTVCSECVRLLAELASSTVEAVAINRDFALRTRAGEKITAQQRAWLDEADAVREQAIQTLRTHKKTHAVAQLAEGFS